MVNHPQKAVEKASVLVSDWMKEHAIGIYVDTRLDPLHIELISLGTVNASLVHPREVFKPALVNSAVGVVLLHNHPSNDVEPSPDDVAVARRLTEAGKILGIKFYDFIVFSPACCRQARWGLLQLQRERPHLSLFSACQSYLACGPVCLSADKAGRRQPGRQTGTALGKHTSTAVRFLLE